MQIKTVLFLLLISLNTFGQGGVQHLEPPKTYWQSFGFQKQVDHVKVGYYQSDSLGYAPVMAEVISFNKEGHLIQKYVRIFGQYASETAYNYVYTNGILDSINTLASAQNFNSQQKLHYDNNGQLTHITATGKFTNYTDTYSYENSGMVATIERKYQTGGSKTTRFNHKSNYVHEKETAVNGKITESYTVYDGDECFATFTLGGQPIVTFYNTPFRSDFEAEIDENALNYALKQRRLKQSDPEAFKQHMSELQSKPTSRSVFDIPAEARNEGGDWTKRLQIDRRFGNGMRRLVFRKLMYADGTESGSTDYDMIFGSKVERIK